MARIGLWGGSFNPPTFAHKAMALHAQEALRLDELHWIVSPHNPLKDMRTLAPFEHRLAMVRIMTETVPAMSASDIEQKLGSSITLNTLRHIRQRHSQDYLFFLMGEDNWNGLHQWGPDYPHLFDYASIAVFRRPNSGALEQSPATAFFADRHVLNPLDCKPSGSWCILENEQMDISATQVRHALVKGQVPEQLDPEVFHYIVKNNLYRDTIKL